MGLFKSWRAGNHAASGPKRARRPRLTEKHVCRFEQLESRQLLSANPLVNLGVVYYENNVGDDSVPDLFEITFNGGAPGTQLTQLVIDTDKDGLGLSIGDCFFDIAPGGLGAYGSQPLTILSGSGIDSVTWSVADGGTRLVFNFSGFHAGEKLVFSIDVDEMGFLGPNSVAEGNEFEGSKLSAVFTAPHYQTAEGGDIFLDYYDHKLAGTGLNLPPDGYVPPGDVLQPDLTAGAIVRLTQVPLPSSIAGTVYEDFNGNNLRESGDVPLQGVQLTLLQLVDGQYVSTGRTTVTDAAGHYRFDALLPGTYRVVETQPAGYLSVGATAGTVGGATRGSVLSPDVIDGISLLGGEDSVNNDFAEFRGASLSGRVAADLNLNCLLDSTDRLLSGVVIQLTTADGIVLATTTTNALGEYRFDGLAPGVYRVVEQQPHGYFDSCDLVGDLGGVLDPPDAIGGIVLFSGSVGTRYDFLEIEPVRLCGYVYEDNNNNGIRDSGEAGIAGVTLTLTGGDLKTPLTAITNGDGLYCFVGLMPGVYTVTQTQPSGYYDGLDTPGTQGGVAENPGDRISAIPLFANGSQYNFGELRPASLSGYVFQDGPTITYRQGDSAPDPYALRDGLRTPDDKPIAGVVLMLCDEYGVPVLDGDGKPMRTTTDANGFYQFTGLRAGTYCVYQTQPEGYADFIDTPGSLGGTAVNAFNVIDPGVISMLATPPRYDAILGIVLGPGQAGTEYNFSEVVLEALPPEPPPPPNPPPLPPGPPASPPPIDPFIKPFTYGVFSPSLVGYPAFAPTPGPALFGGNTGTDVHTWHLSVINAGQPRRDDARDARLTESSAQIFDPASWSGASMGQMEWVVFNTHGELITSFIFGMRGALPVPGDFNGNGKAEPGVFFGGHWFIDLSGNFLWDTADLWAKLGSGNDLPVAGDWDGDGKADIGVYGPAWQGDAQALSAEPGLPDAANTRGGRPKNVPPLPAEATNGLRMLKPTARGKLRADLIDHVFQFGVGGDRPLVGDFNGDGIATIGVFREGEWFLDMDGDGQWSPGDVYAQFGEAGDLPVVGDWTGDGQAKLGVYREGKFILDTNGNRQLDSEDKVIDVPGAVGLPAAADFDGDGITDVAVMRDKAA